MIAKLFFDVPIGLGLPGLTELAREKRAMAGHDQYLFFLNRKRTKCKMILADGVLFCFSKPSGTITVDDIRAMPRLFKNQWVSKSVENSLESWLSNPITSYAHQAKMAS